MLDRRSLMQIAASAGASTVLAAPHDQSDSEQRQDIRIVDTNVSLFQWPFRRLPLDAPAALVRKLRALGIDEAWAGSFEGLLHRDLAAVNLRLAKQCGQYEQLVAIGSVNPTLPDWDEDLRRCHETHGMPGIRLHPNYHGYDLTDTRFKQLLTGAFRRGLFVQLTVAMEDVRTQHPQLRVNDVDLAPLVDFVSDLKGVRLQILNHRRLSATIQALAKLPGVHFDTARIDATDGVPQWVRGVSRDRVVFGSHAPLLIPEAALIRVHESNLLPAADLQAVLGGNAAVLRRRQS